MRLVTMIALGAGTLLLGGCQRAAAKTASVSATKRDQVVQRLIGSRNGVLILANPGNCAFTPNLSRLLQSIADSTGRTVAVALFGIRDDEETLARVRADLKLTVPVTIEAQDDLTHDALLSPDGPPTILVLRNGKVGVVGIGTPALSPASWVIPLLSYAP